MYNRMINYTFIAGVILVLIILVGGIGESNAAGFVKLSQKKLTKDGYQNKRAKLHISKRCKTGIADKLDELGEFNNDLGDIADKLDAIKKLQIRNKDNDKGQRYKRDYNETYKKMLPAWDPSSISKCNTFRF